MDLSSLLFLHNRLIKVIHRKYQGVRPENSEVNRMKYKHLKEDFLAINTLLSSGQIDPFEAHELREYMQSLAA